MCEWRDVQEEANATETEIHLAFLFGFMVEKGAEFDKGDARRKCKYRVVLRGDDAKNQSYEVALFQEMATIPTTLEASRYCDLQSCSLDTMWKAVTLSKLSCLPQWKVLPHISYYLRSCGLMLCIRWIGLLYC